MSGSLGYVFWHWPSQVVGTAEYERRLVVFQDSLKAHAPRGFIDALAFRVGPLPWSAPVSKGYEDWYLVEDFTSLGEINEAAVAKSNRASHDGVAAMAAGGAGGVYKLLQHGHGLPLRDARLATWFHKPAGTTYEALLESLEGSLKDRRADLWQRQMVLGPAPEFCIHSEDRLDLPPELQPLIARVEPLGPSVP